ncbi:bifunctional cytidylyltransferase/SDR family oxidoreductase [Streptomyces olivoreticuli]|uniref:bifunctional cytidylyltransferase/SDR family oxidoreductase n=1 Tax=Streptomyces olivoreticuli TaxID=68246 RepID=UPI000E229170|nr:bifunctional cytidylyltransferase/SDR family oxidoreductase [Streptomyces olivoreticuli]
MRVPSSPQRTVAVVLAAGTGRRVGPAIPKQLIKIAGRPILEHTLRAFEDSPDIDDVLVLTHRDFLLRAEELVDGAALRKVRGVHVGGATRSETTREALEALEGHLAEGEDPKILLHDAVRPLVSQRVITDCVRALDTYQAVNVAIPSSDTVIVTREHGGEGEFVTDILPRERLSRGQTPQAFRFFTLRAAHRIAAADHSFGATDDCSVVLRYLPAVPIHVVRGDEHNMKVTHPVDMFIADKLFQLSCEIAPAHRSESAYRRSLDGKVVVIFGASYGIGARIREFAEKHGARVFAYSRSGTGTHVEHPEDVAAALTETRHKAGRIDYVVNTAALLGLGKLADTDVTKIAQATAVNYLAPLHIARAAHPYLAETRGQLLLYTSSSYTRGRADYSIYSSAKAATVNLTQALADEWAVDGIRVNCINPERTSTPMRWKVFGREPEDTLLTAEEVAQTSVDVLLSGLTGQVIDVRRQEPAALPNPRVATPESCVPPVHRAAE